MIYDPPCPSVVIEARFDSFSDYLFLDGNNIGMAVDPPPLELELVDVMITLVLNDGGNSEIEVST